MKSVPKSGSAPDDIEGLLPWHATGKLGAEETARLDKALLTDPELARRRSLIREEIDQVVTLNERLPAPSGRALDRIMAGVAAEPRQAPVVERVRKGLLEWLGGAMQALSPRALALAACGVAMVVAVQTAMLSGIVGGPDGAARYSTASSPSQDAATGSFVMVAFNPTASTADVTAFLRRFEASIVDGPRASGLFRVRVSGKVLNQSELDDVLARMTREAGIVAMAARGN